MSNEFSFIKQTSTGRTIHVWSEKRQNTLCKNWDFLQKQGNYIKFTEIPNGKVCKGCNTQLEHIANANKPKPKKEKGPKMAPIRPGEQEYLQRWKGVTKQHPSIWEKMDKDPVYEATLKTRDVYDDATTMGNKWGVGRPKGPLGQ